MRIERMKRWVMAMLLCGVCHTAAFAYGYHQDAQSKSWGYQPVYNASVSAPTYQFRTTSSYMNTVGYTDAESRLLGSNGPRRVSPWDSWSDSDNALGEVDDPVPVGDLPWCLMLLLVAGYIAVIFLRQRKARG